MVCGHQSLDFNLMRDFSFSCRKNNLPDVIQIVPIDSSGAILIDFRVQEHNPQLAIFELLIGRLPVCHLVSPLASLVLNGSRRLHRDLCRPVKLDSLPDFDPLLHLHDGSCWPPIH